MHLPPSFISALDRHFIQNYLWNLNCAAGVFPGLVGAHISEQINGMPVNLPNPEEFKVMARSYVEELDSLFSSIMKEPLDLKEIWEILRASRFLISNEGTQAIAEPWQKRRKSESGQEIIPLKHVVAGEVISILGKLLVAFPEVLSEKDRAVYRKIADVINKLIFKPPVSFLFEENSVVGLLSQYSLKFQIACYRFYTNELLASYGPYYRELAPPFDEIPQFKVLEAMLAVEIEFFHLPKIQLADLLMHIEVQQSKVIGEARNDYDARNILLELVKREMQEILSQSEKPSAPIARKRALFADHEVPPPPKEDKIPILTSEALSACLDVEGKENIAGEELRTLCAPPAPEPEGMNVVISPVGNTAPTMRY